MNAGEESSLKASGNGDNKVIARVKAKDKRNKHC